MTTEPKTPEAPVEKSTKAKTFTLAQLARELKTDPKLARRKFRANAAKEKPTKLPDPVKAPGRKNTRYEWPDNAANRKAVTDFLKG
jgi:hypothetical protein